jgi:ABC-type xylose transport system permease subunit
MPEDKSDPRSVIDVLKMLPFFFLYYFGLLLWMPFALRRKVFGREMYSESLQKEGSEWAFVALSLLAFLALGLVAFVISLVQSR